jgi:hypothetical protein
VQQTLLQWRECDSFIYCRINLAAALIAAAAAFRLRLARTPKQSSARDSAAAAGVAFSLTKRQCAP